MYPPELTALMRDALQAAQAGQASIALDRADKFAWTLALGEITSVREFTAMFAAIGRVYMIAGEHQMAALNRADLCAFAEHHFPNTTETSGDFHQLSVALERLGDYVGALVAMERAGSHLRSLPQWPQFEGNYGARIKSLRGKIEIPELVTGDTASSFRFTEKPERPAPRECSLGLQDYVENYPYRGTQVEVSGGVKRFLMTLYLRRGSSLSDFEALAARTGLAQGNDLEPFPTPTGPTGGGSVYRPSDELDSRLPHVLEVIADQRPDAVRLGIAGPMERILQLIAASDEGEIVTPQELETGKIVYYQLQGKAKYDRYLRHPDSTEGQMELDEAVRAYQAGLMETAAPGAERFPDVQADLHYNLGLIFDKTRDHSGAIAEFTEYLERDTTSEWAREARGYIQDHQAALALAAKRSESLPTAQDRPFPFPYRDLREFRALCEHHLTNSINDLRQQLEQSSSARSSGGSFAQSRSQLKTAEPIWRELQDDELMTKTYQTAREAYSAALQAREPRTKHFVHHSTTRLMCITSAPAHGVDGFGRYLSGQGKDYFQFVKPFRDILHGLSGWNRVDFAHWIFLADSVHLFYLENLSSRSAHVALMNLTGNMYNIIAPVELIKSVNSLLSQVGSDDLAASGASSMPSAGLLAGGSQPRWIWISAAALLIIGAAVAWWLSYR